MRVRWRTDSWYFIKIYEKNSSWSFSPWVDFCFGCTRRNKYNMVFFLSSGCTISRKMWWSVRIGGLLFIKSFVFYFFSSCTKAADSDCPFILFIKFFILTRFFHRVVTNNLHWVPIKVFNKITDIKMIHIMSVIFNYTDYTKSTSAV